MVGFRATIGRAQAGADTVSGDDQRLALCRRFCREECQQQPIYHEDAIARVVCHVEQDDRPRRS